MNKLSFLENNEFEANTLYEFEDSMCRFKAEVKFDPNKGYWYTVPNKERESEYKASSLACRKVTLEELNNTYPEKYRM